MTRPRVVLVRGHQANPWDLRPWEELSERFDVTALVTASNLFDTKPLRLSKARVRALSDLAPPGRLRRFAARAPVNRYLGLREHVVDADIVHAAEIYPWWSLQAAAQKRRGGYRLVLTVWETIPFIESYRNVLSRPYRRRILERADLFLAATERARDALQLEGVAAEKIEVSPPGVDLERFAPGQAQAREHLILSVGRLVWEKGHQDILRALAVLRGDAIATRALIVGVGPEERRLRDHAHELGLADVVEFRRHVAHDDMPAVYAGASCLVLASLPTPSWEEQFGMVLVEAMAAGLPIVASTCGAIPEVAGPSAAYFAPGDWRGLARVLADRPLASPAGTRADHPAERVEQFSSSAAAARLARAYDRVLARR